MRSRLRIVLVRPRDPNNIGASARAMKNFGFADLAVVAPWPPVWNEAVSAVNASDVLLNARRCATLAEAVADCTLVVGTADPGRFAGKSSITPAELATDLKGSDHLPALVFGSEKHGLTNDDLSHCHQLLSIPTVDGCPSMNLGQAVAICCYELRNETRRDEPGIEWATAGEIEAALALAMDVLGKTDFILPGNEGELRRKLRRSLLNRQLTKREVNTMCGALRRISSKMRY